MAHCVSAFEDYCRLCAVEGKNGVVIYSSEGLHLCLEEKITQCLRIEVSKDDMLPKKVCQPCHVQLENYHRFAERANRVQHALELLVQMKHHNSPAAHSSNTNMKDCNEVDVKVEEEIQIKVEFEELPLDVILESESDNRIEQKTAESSDEDQSAVDGSPPFLPPVKASERNNDQPSRCTRRRKMLQPKKAPCPQPAVPKRHGHPHRMPSSSSGENSEDDDDGNKLDEAVKPADIEKIEPAEIIDELNIFKGLLEEEAEGEEEEEEEGEDKNAEEEWKTHWHIKCNECEQIFPFKSQFDKHYRNSYNKKPIYTCSSCYKTMEKYSTFRSHCYRHVTEGRYRCEYCQKGFSLKSMLHGHILAKHTTVKPFTCEECGKEFVTKPGLNIHLRKHKTNKKLYPCADCGKSLKTKGSLTAHQNVHKLGRRFMCDLCGKTFTHKVNMQQHVKRHTGERPFTCEKCGKCFAQKTNLNRHYSSHSEKRPFQCTVCLKTYKTEEYLKVHVAVHAEAGDEGQERSHSLSQ